MTVEVSERVLAFARSNYIDKLMALVNDPSVIAGRSREYIKEYFRNARVLARDLGLDFDTIVRNHGNAYERARFADIETGSFTYRLKLIGLT